MLKLLNTYRSFLFGLLIFSYVFSVFQKPVFETLHLICHIPEIIFSQEQIHSYDSHSEVTHTHNNLTAFYDSIDGQGETPQPQSEQETKKKIESFNGKSSNVDWSVLFSKKQFQINLPIQFVFIKIPNPPPKFI
ncbi:MAG: hypothetical protein AB8H03_22120 [Saprospiraceae bacterium]